MRQMRHVARPGDRLRGAVKRPGGRRRWRAGLTLLVVVPAVAWVMYWLGGSQGASTRAVRNVILITVDTLRPDRLSSYGYTKNETPHFDSLARDGVLFEEAFCDVTWTTPSMTSVMTGRYATAHGVRSGYERLDRSATTLAELLRRHGVHTAAIVASFPLASVYGLNQGFDLYDEDFTRPILQSRSHTGQATRPPTIATEAELFGSSRGPMTSWILSRASNDAYRPDNEVSDRAIRWLRHERKEPFFLWLHYFGAHSKPNPTSPGRPPPDERSKRYDRAVSFADQQIGRVLVTLDDQGLAGRTAVVLHADHGESLVEHNYFGHGVYIYDATQHIPMLLRLPGHWHRGRRVARLVRNVDLFPTILELMQVKLTVPVDGSSLLPAVSGKEKTVPEEAYVETYFSAHAGTAMRVNEPGRDRLGFRRMGIRTPNWKFIVNDPFPLVDRDNPRPISKALRARYRTEELYDVRSDPGEVRNVIRAHPALAAVLREEVAEYQNGRQTEAQRIKLDDRARARLRSLGYLE